MNLINNGKLDFSQLENITKKPKLFTKDKVNFWQDPYISEHILYAHLDDESDEGSRKYETVIKSVLWLTEYMDMPKGSRLLDLGCGPGLYSEHFHGQGFKVTGIDFSQNSIDYAKEEAKASQYDIEYICNNYLEIDYTEEFDVITLIYGDLCVLSHQERDLLLKKVRKALKPGGYLIFDLFTKQYFKKGHENQTWYLSQEEGFWKEDEHLLLHEHFKYKKERVRLEKYTLIMNNGEMQSYHIWKHYFSLKRAKEMLKEHQLNLKDFWSDLCGKPYEIESLWIGMIAQKPLK